MPRARRSSLLLARVALATVAIALVACTAHEPQPRIHAPDEPAPALAEWKGPVTTPEQAVTEQTAEPDGDAVADDRPGPVKIAESPETDAYARGKRNAKNAIKRDYLGLETFGYPASCRRDYQKILLRDYKVHLVEVAGCVVNQTILEHARGYNEVMHAEIERRHGKDALDKAARKAGC